MINIPVELKTIYKNDLFPYTSEISDKDLTIYFPAIDLTILTDQVKDDSFELVEMLCSEKNVVFGSCLASKIKFTVADVSEDLTGLEFTITQTVNGLYDMPLGIYRVSSCKKQDDLRFKDIIAYDRMKNIDVDVTAWYNSLFPTGSETYTLAVFRAYLLDYLGIEEVPRSLPNDNMIVRKTIEATQLSGRVVLEACEEINGCFGHINRYGKFGHIVLEPNYGLYPSVTLFPSSTLYPVSETDTSYVQPDLISETVSKAMYERVKFEEYTVKEIDKLIVRSEEDDIGAIVGTGSNAYIIEGNFLVFGKSADELSIIARNAFGNMMKRPYRPYNTDCIGLPYVEVGDTIGFATDDFVSGYVFERTLTGIQALRDNFVAQGGEQLEQNFGVNKEIIKLQGKAAILKKTVEEVGVSVVDLDKKLTGEINVLAGQVILKVDANGKIAAVQLNADPVEGTEIIFSADNIVLEGLVTANGNFKILEDGSMEAVNGKFSGTINVNNNFVVDGSGKMKAVNGEFEGNIIGSNFIGGSILSTGWDGVSYGVNLNEILIENGILKCSKTLYADTGVTITWATTLTYDTLDTKNVITTNLNANTIGNTNPVSLIKFNELLSGGGRIQIEDAESGAIIYVRGTSGSVLLSNGNIVCNQINGSTPVTTSNISSYAATWSALNSLADRVERLGGIHNI